MTPSLKLSFPHLRVAVFLDVHLCKGADVSHARHVDGEVTEEVDYLWGTGTQTEVEDEGSDEGTQQLVQDVHLWQSWMQCRKKSEN